ncbi:hypothetical protein QBE54_09685 [Thermatribacter velox]|uniref:Spore coat protein n=1 Tax=Thermatribacter velox TaxID=3039681 RepID=A0ABZ2YDG1_9BACT
MPFGRGFGGRFAGVWGGSYPGFGWYGRGRGNPYPFCRNFPWLPRGWWAMPYAGYGAYPYAGYYRTYPFPYPPYGGRFYPYFPF